MPKGLQRSLSRGPQAAKAGQVQKAILVLSSEAFLVAGASGVGFGSVVAGYLPEGNLLLLGATSYLQFSGGGADAGLADTWAGDYSVGSTPADDGTVTAADVDIIPSTALAAATAEVSPNTRGANATQAILDNTDGSLEVNVNLLVDDANISADDVAITVTGTIEILYSVLGDD